MLSIMNEVDFCVASIVSFVWDTKSVFSNKKFSLSLSPIICSHLKDPLLLSTIAIIAIKLTTDFDFEKVVEVGFGLWVSFVGWFEMVGLEINKTWKGGNSVGVTAKDDGGGTQWEADIGDFLVP